ncbi:UNVERIFIED_CONTAM: Premnaspirodiene oxygenase [Sesamum latifolium]|uniref:Premnaspirodiene oxygenase n=1 Tax=Sesamum latifolium TaxID=2727402 RepID=A0AAW2X142_9LAMI
MDFVFPLNLTTVALLVLVIFLLIKKWKKSKTLSIKLPPGPKKLPIIGDLHLISALPFRSFRDLAKQYGPIMHLKLGEVSTIVVSSPEIAKEVLREHDPNFFDRPEAIAMKIMCSIRNDEVSWLINSIRLSSGEPVNLTETIFSSTSSITCQAAFGKVCKDSDALIKLLKEGIQMAGVFEIADLFPSSKIIKTLSWSKLRLVMMRRKLDVILDDIINEHKENLAKMARENGVGEGKESVRRGNGEFGNKDLVYVFQRIKESGDLEFPIDNDNIKADMFSTGTETSSTTIDWTMAELMRSPRVMAKAQTESLRLHPQVPILPRASREEREISRYTIPAKVKVLVNNWAMQRDPKYWTNPETFEPERFENQSLDFLGGDFQYLSFGTGRRMCPGMTFEFA